MGDSSGSVVDKSLRSVFVGNIPYEATEEKLKDIFTEVGPVVSFKLVYDRETGKPKGYGFCEYKDQETALSAMRNLNGYEIANRTLRVDNACTEKSRMEMQALMQEPVEESPFGPPVDPEQAPEVISKTVASLPPEQMFLLMQQMKLAIQNNPQETRTMLLQNPQLAYALLQAQVVMRIVDPESAVKMLHKAQPMVPPVGVTPRGPPPTSVVPNAAMPSIPARTMDMVGHPRIDLPPPTVASMDIQQRPPHPVDSFDARGGPPPNFHDDMRGGAGMDRRDPRSSRDPRDRGNSTPTSNVRAPPPSVPGMAQPPPTAPPPGGRSVGPPPTSAASSHLPPHLAGADPEKAQLIMQVLNLTDDQIAMLPPDQRQSIMVLKEQINQGSGR